MSNFIYAYTNPAGNTPWSRADGHSGDYRIKVGESSRPGTDRVVEQQKTATPDASAIRVLLHSEPAARADGTPFADRDVHQLLEKHGVMRVAEGGGREWFEATLEEVRAAIVSLQTGIAFSTTRTQKFALRPEQEEAIRKTATYFRENAGLAPRFLWNAKMRFGKTFTAYQLAKEMKWKRVLVLTYKPAVLSAWRDDLLSHADFEGWAFVDAQAGASYATESLNDSAPLVWFASFQDVIGVDAKGKTKSRNEAIHATEWDCIVIDEYHFGASTAAARELYDPQDTEAAAIAAIYEKAVGEGDDVDVIADPTRVLKGHHHLYLSGTPFKAIARGEFTEAQTYGWTYMDEQREKARWPALSGPNPYAELPGLEMYAYTLEHGDEDQWGSEEYEGFSLSEFFKATGDVFAKEEYVAGFLSLIRGGKRNALDATASSIPFPYESNRFANAVKHSVWYLPDVASCLAMSKMLRADPFFSKYEIHVAAGTEAGVGNAALPPLHTAIRRGEQHGSITLSCGKLMTGVTVPEWASIFMLRSMNAPESYFQAAFRVQSPHKKNGEILKETAYVFDFDPHRATSLVALYGTELDAAEKSTRSPEATLRELTEYLPIFLIDKGHMSALEPNALLALSHAGMDSHALANRWKSADLFDLSAAPLQRLLDDPELLAELQQIEDFRDIKVSVERASAATKKVQDRRDGVSTEPPEDEKKERKEVADQRKNLRDKLRKVTAKVLIFMYLTDAREHRVLDVVRSLDTGLFQRSTGFSLNGFERLVEAGIIDTSRINDAIAKFRYAEQKSLQASIGKTHGAERGARKKLS